MAADVSRQIKSEGKTGPGAPITRDFLGGCFENESKELDLDLYVPIGWEKRLDLQSGKVYIQRCISPSSTSDHKHTNPINQTATSSSPSNPKKQTLNFNPTNTLSLFEDTNLDLKLVSNSPSNVFTIHKNATYQSVCTLDKVKSALDRAWKVTPSPVASCSKKRPSPSNSNSSMISINNKEDLNSQSSSRDCDRSDNNQGNGDGDGDGMLVAGACPGCLLYVLISKTNPKCPKCNSIIPLPVRPKKPKIDLNISM